MKQLLTIGILTVLLGVGCTPTPSDTTPDMLQVDDMGATRIDTAVLETSIDTAGDTSLTTAEQAGILLMREEEKLARDVYSSLYELYGLQIFKNIAASEQTHTDAVAVLLDSYGIPDPVKNMTVRGEFVNTDLQGLYDTLITMGETDLLAALRVGALVEEVDIIDLERLLSETTQPSIISVYQNLLKGSRNHLRAFVRQIEQQNETYTPVRLSKEAYEAIITADIERGRHSR